MSGPSLLPLFSRSYFCVDCCCSVRCCFVCPAAPLDLIVPGACAESCRGQCRRSGLTVSRKLLAMAGKTYGAVDNTSPPDCSPRFTPPPFPNHLHPCCHPNSARLLFGTSEGSAPLLTYDTLDLSLFFTQPASSPTFHRKRIRCGIDYGCRPSGHGQLGRPGYPQGTWSIQR